MNTKIMWILYVLILTIFGMWIIHVRAQNKKKLYGLSEESKLYEELRKTFIKKDNAFSYENYLDYKKIIEKCDVDLVKHTVAIVSGNIETSSVESRIIAIVPTIFSCCSLLLASQLGAIGAVNMEIVATAINVLVLGIYLWGITPEYISVKRQKYFLELMQSVLVEKKEKQRTNQMNQELILKIHMLEESIENLKKKRTKGIHITIDR